MSNIKKFINDEFRPLNFSILPSCISDRMKRLNWSDIQFFIEIMDFLRFYREFEKTYRSIDKDAKIESLLDILLYLKTHSDVKPKIDSFLDDTFDRKEKIKKLEPYMLFCEEEEKQRLLIIEEQMVNNHSELFNSIAIVKGETDFENIPPYMEIKKLRNFESMMNRTSVFDRKKVFIDTRYEVKNIYLRDLYDNLSFDEKISLSVYFDKILNGDEQKHPITLNMALFIRAYSDDQKLPKEIESKHPYLLISSIKDDDIRLVPFMIENCQAVEQIREKIYAVVKYQLGSDNNSIQSPLFKQKFYYYRQKCLGMIECINQTTKQFLESQLVTKK